MSFLGRMPLRRKITAVIMLTTTSVLMLAFTAQIVLSERQELQEVTGELDTLADIIAENTSAAVVFNDTESAETILYRLHANRAIMGAAIYTPDGKPFVRYRTVPRGTLAEQRNSSASRQDRMESYRAIKLRGKVIGTLYVASDLNDLASATRMQITTGISVMVVALLLAMAMTVVLRRLVTKPFVALSAAAQRVIREKNYAVRVDVSEIREDADLRHVMDAFNEMLGRIEARDDSLRRHQAHLERDVEARTLELSTASRRNQMILDAAGEGIFGLDASGTVTFMNPSAARILGCEADQLIGFDLHGRIHAAEEGEITRRLDECPTCSCRLEASARGTGEAVFRGQDGRRIPVEYTSNVIAGDHGEATSVVVTFRDITERLAVERMKDEFVSTVSHELRTPLTSIRGALGLLGSGLLNTAPAKGQRMLEIALANTDRLGRLINDILDLEKMTAGRVDLNRKVLSADDIIRQAVEAMLPMAERADLRIAVHASSASVYADPDRILQLLINLLSNAIKFSPPGTLIEVMGAVKQNQYRVSVRDRGRGVPEDKLETIFQRFQQVDASDSRDKGGTGLGLAICRTIAEAHGGTIWAEQAGPGSIFTFTVPLSHPDLAVARETNDVTTTWVPAAIRERTDVLLVEDDADLARVVIAALEQDGIRVVHAATGRAAMAALERVLPSLIILDVVLPELDGFEVVSWIRRNTTLQNVPLLVYSAEEVRSGDQERLTLGPTEFVTKSRVSIEEFQQRVIRLLSVVTKGVAGAA
jgi:PAS domain S-box-containing protein